MLKTDTNKMSSLTSTLIKGGLGFPLQLFDSYGHKNNLYTRKKYV